MLIGLVLMALNQFCGCFAMINYTGTIFEQAGSSLSPNMSAIIVAFIQLVGSYASTALVEKAGRKILYLTSCVGTGVGLSILGLYINLSSSGYDCSSFKWVPIAAFSVTIFFSTLALLTLCFLVIAEILPPKIRALGSNICMSVLWIFCFLILKFLPFLADVLGLHGLMLLFASVW
uniref:Major facilitator superfamily (MFS) profile domain-containing protein n=1 Tax=Megaselia scalaris TaxID=36166 RepID=T1GSI0_MEGSC